ncbi:hypothetical protein QN401_28790, partial [Pseudomonas sp. 5S3]
TYIEGADAIKELGWGMIIIIMSEKNKNEFQNTASDQHGRLYAGPELFQLCGFMAPSCDYE